MTNDITYTEELRNCLDQVGQGDRRCNGGRIVNGGLICPHCHEDWDDNRRNGVACPMPRPKAKDNCQLCKGSRGGVKGNENFVEAVVVCDYCHADPDFQYHLDAFLEKNRATTTYYDIGGSAYRALCVR